VPVGMFGELRRGFVKFGFTVTRQREKVLAEVAPSFSGYRTNQHGVSKGG
jgi:hypothetical protein